MGGHLTRSHTYKAMQRREVVSLRATLFKSLLQIELQLTINFIVPYFPFQIKRKMGKVFTKTMSSNVLFSPQHKDIQFTAM